MGSLVATAGEPLRGVDSGPAEREKSDGFSLLELLLALAILGASLAVLSQIAGVGSDAAREARALSQARLIAQRQISELLAGGLSPSSGPPSPTPAVDSTSTTPFESEVNVTQAPLDGVLILQVRVRALDSDGGAALADYTLSRWMIDPLLGLAELAAEERAMREEAAP